MNIITTILMIVLFSIISCMQGCGNSAIIIDADFPTPLVKKRPLTIGVFYEESFRNHHYEQINEEHAERDWILETGKAQVALFNRLLGGIFAHTVVLKEFPTSVPADVDAVIYPLVEDLQIAVPTVTKINIFEVWIRYNLRVYSPEGEVIADWIMSGYGKTPTRFLKTQSQAIEQATKLALRDSGANFIIGFEKVPEVQRWLNSKTTAEVQ